MPEPTVHLPSPFENDAAARSLLERLRWPHGAQCPRCGAHDPEVFLIGGEKHSHREGLYQCKRCRKGFSVTVGTSFERLRIPLSTWVNAARAFSSDGKPTLLEIQSELGVAYRTVLRMRDVIERAARSYRGHKYGFGAWPQELMHHKTENRDKTIQATVLKKALPSLKSGEANRTERLLRLLLAAPKMTPRKRRPPLV
ncbi:transposase [Bradyrhizobium sp. BWC-3-1]|uniref:transposase n=1 Tax=Bradyrhizobium sp. BWC-3-1 TaxID=3080012 RepID=UPI00293F1427|nr:transposase [Bradyrhizobium sp. BWC-3-1]WOH59768.1 transposase [Bradyrhizobium sp. BWC-3-1]